MKTIIIEVSGGVVQEVYADSNDLSVIVVDWDNIEAQASGEKCVQVSCRTLAEMPPSTREIVQSEAWIT